MSTPPSEEHDSQPLEPIRVLRPRRTDALAELIREYQERTGPYETVVLPGSPSPAEQETQEIRPPLRGERPPVPEHAPRGRPAGLRRVAVAAALTVAALVGFGGAMLLPDRGDAATAESPAPPAATSAGPAPTGASDPDGAGTLREGARGSEVRDLQQRLLRIPDVYADGSTSGRYDAVLTEAVARFQLWYGIRGDESGVYGDDTRQALESRT